MDYASLLNEEQLKPVMDTEGAVLVLAGAGSGKTRVLTYRIARLVGELNVSPYNVLAITFTNKAAKEMSERVYKVTGQSGIWISTFHSFCAKILRYDIDKLDAAFSSDFSIYTSSDSDKVIKRLLGENYVDDDKLKKSIMWHISNAKNNGFSPDEYRERCDVENADLICKVYGQYDKIMRENNSLDFDDLLLKTVKLFTANKDVLAKWQERFRYIHVDEFQDTNSIQMLLVRLLAMKYGNIFAVGDDDQSIYGWRGAEVENILNFKKFFPGCRLYKLERNYRSTQQILDCANKVIANNTTRLGKELYTNNGDGIKVVYRNLYSDKDEADSVIREIEALSRNNNMSYNDFAVLVRLNSLTRKFEEQLAFYGIPYRLFGGFKFYERKEIQDIIAYLRAIVNPMDQEAIVKIINFPKRGIGDSSVDKLKAYAAAHSCSLRQAVFEVYDNAAMNSATKIKIGGFGEVLGALDKAAKELPLAEIIDFVVQAAGIKSAFDATVLDDQNRLDNIDEFVSSVKEFAIANKEATLSDYLQNVALLSDTDQGDDGERVTLATVHSVKGLEFKVVFIVGLEEQIFPSSRALNSKKEEEEERRCMYVAITRAKERLYLSSSQSRFRFGKYENNLVSRFVKECGVLEMNKSIENITIIDTKLQKALDTQHTALLQLTSSNRIKPDVNKDLSMFKVGVTIVHSRYGDGLLTHIDGENGTVNFEKLGIKEFNLRIAPIIVK